MTASGMVLGTPNYMSPEQAQGHSVDARSDIYSLGCVLYQVLTGALPFESTTPWDLIRQHIEVTPRPARQLNSDIPASVEQLVNRCLAKDPEQRFQSAGELAQALAGLLVTTPEAADQQLAVGVVAPPGATIISPPADKPASPQPGQRKRRGKSWIPATVGAIALLAAVGGW